MDIERVFKLDQIKTQDEFWKFADNWYQRVHKLRAVWQNEDETKERRDKAFALWQIMAQRVMELNTIAIRIKTPKAPIFEKGGINYGK